MNAPSATSKKLTSAARNESTQRGKRLLPALLVIGSACTLLTGTAGALELGPINIQSGLGQPLKASIAYALNPDEQLHAYCVSLKPGPDAGPLPSLTRARVSVRDNMIILTGTTPIREPLLTTQVAVNCPYTIKLARNFLLMINPAEQRPELVAAKQPAPVAASRPAGQSKFTPPATLPEPARSSSRVATAAAAAAATPISAPVFEGSSYLVQTGDTLTSIVSRIEGRTSGFWPAVEAIHLANPHAFLNGDRDFLQAGSTLTIPSLADGVPTPVASASTESSVPEIQQVEPEPQISETIADDPDGTAALSAYDGFEAEEPATSVVQTAPEPVEPMEFIEPVIEPTTEPMDDTSVLQSDDTSVAEEPVVSEVAAADDARFGLTISGDAESPATVDSVAGPVAEDTPVEEGASEGPAASVPDEAQPAEQPRAVPVVASREASDSSGLMSWLIGLGAAGLAFLTALYLIRRRMAEQREDTPAGITDPETGNVEVEQTAKNRVVSDVDFQFDATPAEEPTLTLDADLGAGTGLQDSTDMDVAQDFGFSADSVADSAVDLELPEEAPEDPEPPSTDIIPVNRVPEPTILDSEVPPEDGEDDEEYDLSMIVDATKQSMHESDETAKDLQAVPIEDQTGNMTTVTVDQEAGLKTLEQDYEDELTATQAFNDDIAKAAEEIALGLDGNVATDVAAIGDDDDTSISAALTTLDDDGDETAIATAIAALEEQDEADIPTAIAPMDEAEVTVEMPPAGEAELTANLETLTEAGNDEFEEFEVTVVNEELTDEVPELNLEPTVEMDLDPDSVDPKESKVS